jgi:hypothetical protein
VCLFAGGPAFHVRKTWLASPCCFILEAGKTRSLPHEVSLPYNSRVFNPCILRQTLY